MQSETSHHFCPGLFPQGKVTGAAVRQGLHPAGLEEPGDNRVSPVSGGAPGPACGCPGAVHLLQDVLDPIPVPAAVCVHVRPCLSQSARPPSVPIPGLPSVTRAQRTPLCWLPAPGPSQRPREHPVTAP